MQLSDKLKEYLVNSLMRDKENLEREILTKEDIIAKLGIENGKEKTIADDWKLKYFKLEEENCELKKKVKRLDNDKTFHINELQKNNNAVKEVEVLKEKIKAQESEILKLTMQNMGKEVKRGRPAKEVK